MRSFTAFAVAVLAVFAVAACALAQAPPPVAGATLPVVYMEAMRIQLDG